MEEIEVVVINRQEDLPVDTLSVEEVVQKFLAREGVQADELSVMLVSEEEICQLHADYFDDPTPTDCITFPIDEEEEEGYRLLGDLFICPMTAIKYVEENGGDPYTELTLYLVHGLLHLLGYDDIEPADREKMRAAEARHMEALASERSMVYP